MKKKIPWLSKEERRHMEIIRSDIQRQMARTRDRVKVAELERQLLTLSRELEFDK
jgi:phosphopantetheinyl transferase